MESTDFKFWALIGVALVAFAIFAAGVTIECQSLKPEKEVPAWAVACAILGAAVFLVAAGLDLFTSNYFYF